MQEILSSGRCTCRSGKVGIGSQTGLFMRVLDDLIKFKTANASRSHVVITSMSTL